MSLSKARKAYDAYVDASRVYLQARMEQFAITESKRKPGKLIELGFGMGTQCFTVDGEYQDDYDSAAGKRFGDLVERLDSRWCDEFDDRRGSVCQFCDDIKARDGVILR